MLMMYLSALDTQEEKTKFEKLYIKYEGKMYAVAYKILGNSQDAEDIVQDTFWTLIENLEKIDDISCHKTWNYIVTIVKNKAINLYHRKKRHGNLSMEENFLEKEFSREVFTEAAVEKREIAQITARLILALPERYRYVLYLYYYQEQSYAQIAECLDMTEANARQTAKRARKLLEEKLREEGITHG